MRIAATERIEPAELPAGGPIELVQVPSRLTPVWLSGAAIAASALLIVPFAFLATAAASTPAVLGILADKPLAGAQLTVALALALIAVAAIVRRVIQCAGRRRTVRIDAGTVTVRDDGLFRTTTWQQPLDAYCGLAHHVRASLSGSRDEIVLIHPDSHHDVVVRIAPRIASAEVSRLAARLGLAELPARALYDGGRQRKPLPVDDGMALAA